MFGRVMCAWTAANVKCFFAFAAMVGLLLLATSWGRGQEVLLLAAGSSELQSAKLKHAESRQLQVAYTR